MSEVRSPRDVAVSVVVPVFEEEAAVAGLAREIRDALATTAEPYEILFVDDGSRDGTAAAVERVRDEIPAVRLIRHARNCGQSAAVATGFRCGRGEIFVTMDGDGQNDPADVPRLLAALTDADVVCGVRAKRRDTFVRRASSRIANGFRSFVTGDRFQDVGCGLRAIRREALVDLPVFNGMHRFLPTLLSLQGLKIAEVPVGHRQRETGRSKYGISNRAFRGLVDCLAMVWWRRRAVPSRRVLSEDVPASEPTAGVDGP